MPLQKKINTETEPRTNIIITIQVRRNYLNLNTHLQNKKQENVREKFHLMIQKCNIMNECSAV
jgi:hypothetical protein